MSVFEGQEGEAYNQLAIYVTLARNSTFMTEGATYKDLLWNHAFDGASPLVDSGHVERITRKVDGEEKIFYRLTDSGRKVLDGLLEFLVSSDD
jgi:hypothetical protein|tara:strand:+ start:2985 stop:3263 length:279 start_codon:yes stop_codon:yes gene_type:complete